MYSYWLLSTKSFQQKVRFQQGMLRILASTSGSLWFITESCFYRGSTKNVFQISQLQRSQIITYCVIITVIFIFIWEEVRAYSRHIYSNIVDVFHFYVHLKLFQNQRKSIQLSIWTNRHARNWPPTCYSITGSIGYLLTITTSFYVHYKIEIKLCRTRE